MYIFVHMVITYETHLLCTVELQALQHIIRASYCDLCESVHFFLHIALHHNENKTLYIDDPILIRYIIFNIIINI